VKACVCICLPLCVCEGVRFVRMLSSDALVEEQMNKVDVCVCVCVCV
jgi:hypothetical protein